VAVANNLLAQRVAAHFVGAVHRAEDPTIDNARLRRPRIDRHPDPRRHRDSPHASVLANEVHNAPTAIPLLNMAHPASKDQSDDW
jgi:hypothetical protein